MTALAGGERLAAVERLDALFDDGSLQLLRTEVRSRRLGDRAEPGDGALAATGRVDGRPVVAFAQDGRFLGGSLGAAHAETVAGALRAAGRARVPVVGLVESGGARMQEGVDALDGYARIFAEHVRLARVVPQISVVCGAAAGGGAYGPALTDFVVLAPSARMFLTGPAVVREVLREDIDAAALGGPGVHGENGVAHLEADGEGHAIALARALLAHLPSRAGEAAPAGVPEAPGAFAGVPADPRRVYDVRDVARGVLDGGRLLEVAPRWARNAVCAMGRLDGRPIGLIANQPRHLGGVLDADAAQKAAWFVGTCDRFGLPLLVLVDTPGFLPGSRQERGGVIRHGASLVRAFAGASVPRVTVVLRKAFGGAFIAMNARGLGADLVLAWPGAQLGVMAAAQAVGVTHRRALAEAADPDALRAELAARYAEEHLGAGRAAADGHVDAVIAPEATRERVAAAFALLADAR